MNNRTSITVAITGASGSCYGIRLIEVLCINNFRVNLICSENGIAVTEFETGFKPEEILRKKLGKRFEKNLKIYDNKNLFSGIASGSYLNSSEINNLGMIIIPCSMGTLGRIAHGISSDLISRAADVYLKEKKKLILVPRETPLSIIHLENMQILCKAGAHIVPAMPAFYHKPQDISELIDFVVGKILDTLEIKLKKELFIRWEDSQKDSKRK